MLATSVAEAGAGQIRRRRRADRRQLPPHQMTSHLALTDRDDTSQDIAGASIARAGLASQLIYKRHPVQQMSVHAP